MKHLQFTLLVSGETFLVRIAPPTVRWTACVIGNVVLVRHIDDLEILTSIARLAIGNHRKHT